MRSRQFQFVYGPESGIADVAVKKLRLKVYGKKERIVLEADPTLQQACGLRPAGQGDKGNPVDANGGHSSRHQGDIRANPTSRKASTRSFDIGWPNSCSLKHDGRDLIIRKMLADSGIEPREPAKDDSCRAMTESDLLEHIFERLSRANSATRNLRRGRGRAVARRCA